MLLKRIGRKMLVKMKPNPWKKRRIKRFGTVFNAVQHYCTNTTLHGLRYIADSELHVIERIFWLAIFAISSFVASNVIYTLARRFQEAPTSVGIQSTNYKIDGVPFPSVTLCPNDRVDWNKLLVLERELFPNTTDKRTLQTFHDILGKLSSMTFGDFDELTFIKNRNLDDLRELNITEILLRVRPDCEALFSHCWWRNSNRDCCEIFELQKTEYGYCYSFNSGFAERAKTQKTEERPRRASGYGDWSGVKVTIHLGNLTKPPNSEEIDGVVLIISDPRAWPNSGTMIPAGSLASVSMDCASGYATQPVLELDEKRSPCKHMKTVSYNQETCLSFCKRAYAVKHCGCNPAFLFPASSKRDCKIEDFHCLIEHNDVFNDYYVVSDESDVYDRNGMLCGCPPECEYYIYIPQTSTVPIYESQDITLDVHFASQTSFRYKTDIVITDLDLLVSFGGIIGLFLGGSLLSAAELIYYLLVLGVCYLRSWWDGRHRVGPVRHTEKPTVLAMPILDYGPIKPRAKRIPVLVNYDWKSNVNRY